MIAQTNLWGWYFYILFSISVKYISSGKTLHDIGIGVLGRSYENEYLEDEVTNLSM